METRTSKNNINQWKTCFKFNMIEIRIKIFFQAIKKGKRISGTIIEGVVNAQSRNLLGRTKMAIGKMKKK